MPCIYAAEYNKAILMYLLNVLNSQTYPVYMLHELPQSSTSGYDGFQAEIIILLNDALGTFYLRLYGVRLMVKNH